MLVKIERKLFEMTMVGKEGDGLKITERNNLRRSTVILTREDRIWLEKAWTEFWEGDKKRGWFRRRRVDDRTIIMQLSENKWGRMVTLSVLKQWIYQTVICSEGKNQQGWKSWNKAMMDTSKGSNIVALQRPSVSKNMMVNRSWREVVSKIPRLEEQFAHKAGKEFPVEIYCGNCGWTLK